MIKILIALIFFCMVGMCVSMITMASEDPPESRSTSLAHDNVYIFISFSMPPVSLQQWAAQAQKIHAPLVIQGLVEDSFPKTQQAVAALSKDGQGGVVLDPRLFDRYHITRVPTVVVIHPVVAAPCSPQQSCWRPEMSDVVTGDVGLETALQTMADHGDAAETAQQFLAEERQS